jgi:hypothetical protein
MSNRRVIVGDVAGFRPSVNGLQFINSWPSEPDLVVNVPPIGNIPIGDASNGLCGGMAFTVLDVFKAGLPPLLASRPSPDSPLFKYIVRRLFDSFDIPDGVLKYYQWMSTADADLDIWITTVRGVAWLTIMEEWPAIQADLDAGHPSPLGLVTVETRDPTQMGHNHQVLAYGYERTGDDLQVKIYDPNTDPAQGDGIQMSLNLANPTQKTPITHNISIANPVRGFFRVPYVPSDPSGLESVNPVTTP